MVFHVVSRRLGDEVPVQTAAYMEYDWSPGKSKRRLEDTMARAFTKESDNEDVDDPIPEPVDVLPPGVKNYITPNGAARHKERLDNLIRKERPAALDAAGPDGDPARKKKQRQIDRQIRLLGERIANFEVIDPVKHSADCVSFGATVTVRDEEGREKTYQICGVDETDPDSGKISWISPIARALRSREVGDEITVHLPRRKILLEIVKIDNR